jgi:hypothetical protein
VGTVQTTYHQAPNHLAAFEAADCQTKGTTIPAKFSEDQVAAIDAVAVEYGITRSEFLRDAAQLYLAFHDNPYLVMDRLAGLAHRTGQSRLEITMSALAVWEAVQFTGAGKPAGR